MSTTSASPSTSLDIPPPIMPPESATDTSSLRRFSSLAITLAVTEFKLRYAGSALSYLWSFCKPLMLFGVLYFVFAKALKFGAGIPHFPVILLFAIVLWAFFAEVTGSSVSLLVSRADLLRKISFPRLVLPLSVSLSSLLTLALNLLAVLVFALASGVQPSLHWFVIVPLILQLYLLSLAFALALSALFVRFRDIGQIWEVLLQALFYATPIIYPLTTIPNATIQKIILISPIAQIVQQSRRAVVPQAAQSLHHIVGMPLMFAPYAITIALLIGGFAIYQRVTPTLVEHL